MPYTLQVGDLVKVAAMAKFQEHTAVMTQHLYCVSIAGASVTDLDLADYLDGQYAALVKSLINNLAVWSGVSVQKIYPLPVPIAQVANNNPGVGTAGADPLPRQTSGLAKIQTTLAGRRNRGRVYVPWPAAQDNITPDDIPSFAYMVRLGAFATSWELPATVVVGANSATLQVVIAHRPKPPSTVWTATFTAGFVTRRAWATQRRRGTLRVAHR